MKLGNTLLVMLLGILPSLQAQEHPREALCAVCVVQGETQAEKVKATSSFEGNYYYFCSQKCKEEFDVDPHGYVPPILPRPAPGLVALNLAGEERTLSDFKARFLLIDFWATWCKPCVKSMPELNKLQQAHSDSDLVVIGISIDEGKEASQRVAKFVQKHDLTYPILLDLHKEPAWQAFHVRTIPAMFLIDEQRQIVQQWRGDFDFDEVKTEVVMRLQETK